LSTDIEQQVHVHARMNALQVVAAVRLHHVVERIPEMVRIDSLVELEKAE
jgi:hypothetical protein